MLLPIAVWVVQQAERIGKELLTPAPWINGLVAVALTTPIFAISIAWPRMERTMRDLWEDYSPIVTNWLLAFPLVHLIRRPYTSYLNYRISRRKKDPTLLRLPDELLLEISSWLMLSACPSSRTDDAKCYGCPSSKRALAGLTRTNRRIRGVTATILFFYLKIHHHSWRKSGYSLHILNESVHPSTCTRALTLDLHFCRSSSQEQRKAEAQSPKRVPKGLVTMISALQSLQKLVLVVPTPSIEKFKVAFEKSMIALPTVRILVLGPHLEWLVPMCPNVQSIAAEHRSWHHTGERDPETLDLLIQRSENLIRAASKAPKLWHFEIWHSYSLPCHRKILKAMPHLRSLGLTTGDSQVAFDELLLVLARFPNLTTLALCSTPTGLLVSCHGSRSMDPMVRFAPRVFGSLKGLNELWIGPYDRGIVSRRPPSDVAGITWLQESRLSSSLAHRFA